MPSGSITASARASEHVVWIEGGVVEPGESDVPVGQHMPLLARHEAGAGMENLHDEAVAPQRGGVLSVRQSRGSPPRAGVSFRRCGAHL